MIETTVKSKPTITTPTKSKQPIPSRIKTTMDWFPTIQISKCSPTPSSSEPYPAPPAAAEAANERREVVPLGNTTIANKEDSITVNSGNTRKI